MDNEYEIVKCCYCGRKMNLLDSNNPCDYGLHANLDKYTENNPKYCCGYCNNITAVNRLFAQMIYPDRHRNMITSSKVIAFELRQIAQNIEENSDKIQEYYLNQTSQRYHNDDRLPGDYV